MQMGLESGKNHIRDLFIHPALNAQRRHVGNGGVVFDASERAEKVYFIEKGQVRLFKDGPSATARLLDILGTGDWFGVAGLTEAATYGERAVAAEATVVLEVSASAFRQLLSTNSSLAAIELIKQLAAKVQFAREDAATLVFEDCNQRLIKTLVRFSSSAAARTTGESVVLNITHHQLAQAVGAARETISLALTQLRLRNLLQTGRNQLTFNPKTLARFERWADERVELTETRTPEAVLS